MSKAVKGNTKHRENNPTIADKSALRSIVEPDRQAWASAFFNLDSEIRDLKWMVRIVWRKVHETVGETTFDRDGTVKTHELTNESICETMFLMGKLMDMITEFEARYDADFSAGRETH